MTGGFAPGCPACGALPAHPCRRSRQSCPRMPPKLTTATRADLERISRDIGPSAPVRPAKAPAPPAKPLSAPDTTVRRLGSNVLISTPQHPAFAYPCPECESAPYASCRAPNGDYLGHRSIHVARTRVGAPVADDGEPVFREHNHTTPAQDIARLAYWIRFWEATGAEVPKQCKTEVAEAISRWPLESKR